MMFNNEGWTPFEGAYNVLVELMRIDIDKINDKTCYVLLGCKLYTYKGDPRVLIKYWQYAIFYTMHEAREAMRQYIEEDRSTAHHRLAVHKFPEPDLQFKYEDPEDENELDPFNIREE